jgi:hypothetical protein
VIEKHIGDIFKSNRGRRSSYIMCYLSCVVRRRQNDFLNLRDVALSILLEAREEFLEFPCLVHLPVLFDSLTV